METNRGRSFRLTNAEDLDAMATLSTGRVITRKLEVTKGTTITGLYAHQVRRTNRYTWLRRIRLTVIRIISSQE